MPKAVGQAIAWAKVTGFVTFESLFVRCVYQNCLSQKKVHFCLSNGQIWWFFILQSKDDEWVYYESVLFDLYEYGLKGSGKSLFRIIQLIMEWVSLSFSP
jgi:hypothetical protein